MSSVNSNGDTQAVLKKGPWTTAEDSLLREFVEKYGEGNWNAVQRNTGLLRCGKSCRLRWIDHLRPELKKAAFSQEEESLIIDMHVKFGNKWAKMASQLPGRTDNEIKNFWNTRAKRMQRAGLPLYPLSDENARQLSSGDREENQVLQQGVLNRGANHKRTREDEPEMCRSVFPKLGSDHDFYDLSSSASVNLELPSFQYPVANCSNWVAAHDQTLRNVPALSQHSWTNNGTVDSTASSFCSSEWDEASLASLINGFDETKQQVEQENEFNTSNGEICSCSSASTTANICAAECAEINNQTSLFSSVNGFDETVQQHAKQEMEFSQWLDPSRPDVLFELQRQKFGMQTLASWIFNGLS